MVSSLVRMIIYIWQHLMTRKKKTETFMQTLNQLHVVYYAFIKRQYHVHITYKYLITFIILNLKPMQLDNPFSPNILYLRVHK